MKPRFKLNFKLRFRIVRFFFKRGWIKSKKAKFIPNSREILAKDIIFNLLGNKENKLYTLTDTTEKKRYIKNDIDQIYVIITEDTNYYHVLISNHNYLYDIELRIQMYNDIKKTFDRFLYNRRKNMETEMLDNINENLLKIRDRAKGVKKN